MICRELTFEQYEKIIQKQAEEIKISSTQLANIKNALDESSIVAITDKNGIITYVNKKFCELSGYEEKELVGRDHRILKSGFHSPAFYKDMWDTISRGHVWHGVIKNLTKNGKYYWVKTTITPFLDYNGVPEQYIAIRTDITKEKEMQENILKMEKLSAIGELSAKIAHDIRNPLSVIKNNFEILQYKNKGLGNYDKESFERIGRAVRRINHQIDDVLDYVHPKSLALKEEKIHDVIQSSLDECAIPKSVVVNVSRNDITLFCDAEKLGIVFTNLILNAIQAMAGTGTIDIRCSNDDKNITIEIRDTGPGIPDNLLPKIFDPLFTTRQIGTGLGLTSCKSIVEKHGGKIDVQTQLGKGTTFTIIIPKKYPSMAVEGDY